MPGRTTGTTGGRIITKDLQATAAIATLTQGAGLVHLLGEVLGIAIGFAIAIKIKIELIKHVILLIPTWIVISLSYNLTIQAFHAVKYFSQRSSSLKQPSNQARGAK